MRNARSGATPSFRKRSTASLASLSTQADFISDGQRLSPNKRLAHQPRFGCALSSLPVLEITGVGGGALVRGCGAEAPPVAGNGAGSRIVERRRGGSGGAAGTSVGGGVAGRVSTGACGGASASGPLWKGGATADASSSLTGGKSVPACMSCSRLP